MNKFKKLLLLMLALVLVLTAFTVTALATDEEQTAERGVIYANRTAGYDDLADGETSIEADATGKGKFQIATGEDGNKYVLHTYEAATSGTSYISVMYRTVSFDASRSLANYPYSVVDFHIKMTGDNYEGFQIVNTAYFHPNNSVSGTLKGLTSGNFRLYNGGAGSTSSNIASASGNYSSYRKLLPNQKGVWSHITLVTYTYFEGNTMYCNSSTYVNGEFACSELLFTANVAEEYLDTTKIYHSQININEGWGSTSTTGSAYDNITTSVFGANEFGSEAKDYSDDIAEYIYETRGKNLPYGETVATVDGQIYDDINKAIEAANASGSAVELRESYTGTIEVDKPITINANGSAATVTAKAGTGLYDANEDADVYEFVQAEIEVIIGEEITYYKATEFYDAINEARSIPKKTAVTKVILHADVETDCPTIVLGRDKNGATIQMDLTLDLNGHTLRRVYKYSTGSAQPGLFGTAHNNWKFALTSSAPGAAVYNTVAKTDADGNIISTGYSSIVYGSPSLTGKNYGYLNINTNNSPENRIAFYATSFVTNHDNSSRAYSVINIDNCDFYRTLGTDGLTGWHYAIFSAIAENPNNPMVFNISNTTIYDGMPAVQSSGSYDSLVSTTSAGTAIFNFTNCDIIGARPGDLSSNFYVQSRSNKVNFDNCRLYNIKLTSTKAFTLGADTYLTVDNANNAMVESGYVLAPQSFEKEYYIPSTSVFEIDENGELVKISMSEKAVPFSYTYAVAKPSETAGSITDAKLSMIYTTSFKLMLYVPVMEGRAVSSVEGFTYEGDVNIDGVKHHAYAKDLTTAGAGDNVITSVAYTVNGENYRQTYTVSALVYANLALSTTDVAVEKSAVGNMVRYIKEAKLAVDEAADVTAFDALITAAGIGAYSAVEAENESIANVSDYVESINFVIENGVASYKLTLKSADYANMIAVTVMDGEEVKALETEATDATLTVKNARVYDAIKTITITVTDGENVSSGTYSIKDNIAATDSNLVKALYDFGVAAKAYRDYAIAQNEAEAEA